ncbi:MAG: hypothetical protein J6I46_16340 [Ruminococcus sp.]|nr:hypothetical protein [Ruminococcus sp.]
MGADKKKRSKLIKISVIAAAMGLLQFLLPMHFRDSLIPKSKPDAKYTAEDIDKLAGTEFKHKDTKLRGVECVRCYRNEDQANNYQRLSYYVFCSSKDANKAFKKLKGTFKENTLEEDENFISGYEDGVMDAEIQSCFLIDSNLIVGASAAYSHYYSIEEEQQVQENNKKQKEQFEELRKWIPENF